MTKKTLICSICKKKQWGLTAFTDGPIDFGLCNDCYEIWDAVNSKLGVKIQ